MVTWPLYKLTEMNKRLAYISRGWAFKQEGEQAAAMICPRLVEIEKGRGLVVTARSEKAAQ